MKKSAFAGWAIGSFTSAALVSSVGLLHLRFMTDSLGIAIGIAGGMTVLAKIYDAATDPLMGFISDNTRTPWGKFRPYLLGGGLLAAIALVMLFNVPNALEGAGMLGFVGISLLIFSTAYTMFRIPYLAMGRAITQDFDERSKLMTFSVYGSSLGSLAATSAAPFLLAEMGSDRAGHGLVAIILASLVALGGCVTFLLLKEQHEVEATPPERTHAASLSAAITALRENKPFLCLIGYKVTIFSGLTLHLAALPYYTKHVLEVSDKTLGSLFLAQTLMMMISQLVWVRLARIIGRRNMLISAALISAAGNICWLLVPLANPTPFAMTLGAISGFASGGVFLGLYTILSDTMDYSKRTQGENRAGILAGIFVMVEKATAALGVFIFSMILSIFGFVSTTDAAAHTQSAEVQAAMVISLSAIPATLAVIACLFMLRYRLPAQDAPGADDADELKPALN